MSLGAVPGRATAEAVVSPVFAIRARIDHRSKRAFYRSVPLLAVGAGVLCWELRRREVLDSHAETKRRFDAMKIAGVEFYGRATGFSTDRELHEKLQAGDFLFYTRKLSALHAHEAVREIMLRSQFLGWLVAAAGGGGAGLRLDTTGNVIVPQKDATACVAAQAEATSFSTAAKEAPPSRSSGCPFAPAALASRLRALLPAQGISGSFSSTASGAPAPTQPRFVTSSDVPMRVAACALSPDGELCVEGLPYHEWLAQPATGDVVARFVRQRRGAGHHQVGEGGTAETARADKGSTKVHEISLSEFRALLTQRPGVEVVPLMRGDDESFVTVSEGTARMGKRDGGRRKRDEALLVQINGKEVSVTDAKLGAEVIVR
mmetsp:Transcript_8542/g.20696  ORF Transcript_8542/g.20696 Transcript_8542/m.20696 type:complete len:375 (-) Transcript_8542:144-1268(-)|eukprot:CAMPEP_0178984964 /NCGR_PEP_ID=MMETSP0795-20121207/1900_1 /TAXON_ID=88552 /ORGANISM="Amoebophrya sp., Strain Ameob2" /LENGTH=374 /DNA_ID=CAMNT_0020675891 /DNA_START=215 /DNA_END=1339 /DNA_ORIENTATION=+